MIIQQLLKDACEDHGEVSFRNDYSGRGMYGETCVGIVGSHSECMEVIANVIKEAAGRRLRLDDVVDTLLTRYSEDRMGRSKIIYWESMDPIGT